MSKRSTVTRPNFTSEKQEADWYHTPEGRAYMQQSFEKALREGRVKVRNKPTDPAVLQKILEQARQALLQPINLRLPQGDIDAAKRLAAKTGKKYQAILKEIIHEGLKNAS